MEEVRRSSRTEIESMQKDWCTRVLLIEDNQDAIAMIRELVLEKKDLERGHRSGSSSEARSTLFSPQGTHESRLIMSRRASRQIGRKTT